MSRHEKTLMNLQSVAQPARPLSTKGPMTRPPSHRLALCPPRWSACLAVLALGWGSALNPPTARPTETSAQLGYQLFLTGSCASCHTVRGTPARGQVGPDLTHLASRLSLAAGTLPNTPANLARWLKNPQAVKPGCLMPNLYLTDQQVRSLVAFLERLK